MSSIPKTGDFLGHPKGLFLLFGTEMWERFSYYGMRAILVLYLVDLVERGGLGFTRVDALSLYGTFTMLVYLTPLVGGWLADNILGQRKSIIIGGILMALGQFTLGTPHEFVAGFEREMFYAGLALLICGNGLFKPNISTMVGDLYDDGDHRRDGAFTIFYMGINLGAAIAPIVVGTIAEKIAWQYGFIAAGVGMIISVIMIHILGNKYLGNIGVVPAAVVSQENSKSDKKEPLTSEERDRIKVIFIMSAFTIIFWAGFEQAGGLMNIFANDYTDRMIGAFEVPASWFQSVNAIFIVLFAPIIATIWVKMGPNEPTSPVKFAFGMFFLAIGFLFMIGATMQQGGDVTVKTSMSWLIFAYLFHTLGELCLSPIGLSMVSKLAPMRLASMLMGIWFLFTAMANKVAAFVGSFIGEGADSVDNAMAIFAGIAITATVSGIILYLISGKLVDWMHGAEGNTEHTEEENLEAELEITAAR
ncbi:dipeptide/tripeptide permease [Pseudoalteromonas sp. NBT06-2]|uniref:peptide MFS transporter n=1 Tax=Pseudoalteromonas sp. NBT06-2 TaxID=2025950 RepID=UPI000BA54C79|nr:peptide MFS transporter [Pseudoalteromonas sp. NBT06-2]PAJ73485.1 dipeptide/tripeptide permease [Pseudoalteromonas sp. NBT06-2]